jgi:glycosyltransferase involved in cell wall biosynthesis
LPILNQLAQKYGDKVQFKIIAKTKIFNALETKNKILIGDPQYYDGQFVDYEKYLQTLRESDIALLPLLDNEFNRSKSDLKFIECGACGAAVLASSVVYPKTVKDGVTGLIFNDKKEFAQKLQLLIENPEKRYNLATAAYDYVKNNRLLSQHYEERLDWYNELFERLDELNAEAQERIDKIAPKFEIEGKNKSGEEIIIPDNW